MTTILDSLHFLKEQKWIDLTHAVSANIPYFSAFQPLKESVLFTVEKDGFLAKKYEIVSQYGTHIDAPIHFSKGKRFLEQLTLKELVLPLVVIHKEKEVDRNSDYEVSIEDIIAFEETYGPIPSESLVAFASGWSKRWNTPDSFYNVDEKGQSHTPGWSLDALKFLNEKRNVCAIGHETLDTDSSASVLKNNDLVGERYWLSQNKFQVEVLANLSDIPPIGSVIVLGVPKIAEAPGFTIRAFAIVSSE